MILTPGYWLPYRSMVLSEKMEPPMEITRTPKIDASYSHGNIATRMDHPLEFEQFCSFIQRYVRENDMILCDETIPDDADPS
jgi:hypothetical protein